MNANDETDEDVARFQVPRDRVATALFRGRNASIVGVAVAAAVNIALGIPGPVAVHVLWITVASCIAAALLWPRSRPWEELIVAEDGIEVGRLGEYLFIPGEDICLVWGEGGLRLDGGPILVWRKICFRTLRDAFRFDLGNAATNEYCYRCILSVAPSAVGVPYEGDFRLPEPFSDSRDDEVKRSLQTAVPAEQGHQTRRYAVLTLSAIGLAAGVFIIAILTGGPLGPKQNKEEMVGKLAATGILVTATVCGLILVWWRASRRWQRLRHVINGRFGNFL